MVLTREGIKLDTKLESVILVLKIANIICAIKYWSQKNESAFKEEAVTVA